MKLTRHSNFPNTRHLIHHSFKFKKIIKDIEEMENINDMFITFDRPQSREEIKEANSSAKTFYRILNKYNKKVLNTLPTELRNRIIKLYDNEVEDY